MARYRYPNCSEPVAVRRRRPRRAARARTYVTHPARDLAPLTLAVRRWISHTTPEPAATASPATASGSGFTAAVASRPRIRALREAIRSRTRPEPASIRKNRAAARLRVRTATIRATTRMTADRDGLWKDSLAAARILKWNLGRAA